jgi:hypothetical protein
MMRDGATADSYDILARIDWALTAGLIVAYAVTYAIPAAV